MRKLINKRCRMPGRTWGNNGSDEVELEFVPEGSEHYEYKEPEFIETIDNRIMFYADVSREHTLQLNKTINDLANTYLYERQHRDQEHVSPIYLNIFSHGGDIFSGLSVMDEIVNCKVPVYTVVDGCCASAATLFSVVGKKRFIKRNSFMLIHQLSSGMWGKYAEILDEMENLNKFMSMVRNVYVEHTEVPDEKLDEILSHDLWFTAEECLKYKMVDKIL